MIGKTDVMGQSPDIGLDPLGLFELSSFLCLIGQFSLGSFIA